MPKIDNYYKPAPMPKGKATPKGEAGYDNPRENIDPHIKTKVLNAKEIITMNLSGSNISALNISGANIVSSIIKDTGLTSGRLTFAGTGGQLTDDSELTYSTTTNQLSLNLGQIYIIGKNGIAPAGDAPDVAIVQGGTGGASASGSAGKGSSINLTAETGGEGTAVLGGKGGDVNIYSGIGGNNIGPNIGGAGGDIHIFTSNGTAGGAAGNLYLSESYGNVYLPRDNEKLLFGAGLDAGIYYDGTDMNIKTSEIAASDLNITCGANKTIELQNAVYDDLQFIIGSGKLPAANFPTYETFTTNTRAYAFSVNDYIYLDANELPHWWKQGTAGDAHLHFTLKTANNSGANRYAKFQIIFAYADIDEAWVEQTMTGEYTIPNGTAALTNLYLDMGDVTLTNYLIGSQITAKVTRIAATGGTEYADDVYITQTGVHLQKDTMGSRNETSK